MTVRALRITSHLTIPEHELQFRFSRSGGPGGRHVNKASTRVELLYDVAASPSLSNEQRRRVLEKLGGFIGRDGVLRVVCDSSRSQWQNRETALDRLVGLLQTALARPRKRISTKPSLASRAERSKKKQLRGRKKALRRKVRPEDAGD